jgi:predicted acetyltransferase
MARVGKNRGVTDIEVLEAGLGEKPVLQQMMQLYLHDFSEFMPLDVNVLGTFEYPWLDNYWTDADRRPFVFRVDGRWAGFALVRVGTPHDMAEFFVMRGYRSRGVGVAAARAVIARFPGPWQTRQVAANVAATSFWRRAIPIEFEEDVNDSGPVQRFSVPS